jgi:hypothetical protein
VSPLEKKNDSPEKPVWSVTVFLELYMSMYR